MTRVSRGCGDRRADGYFLATREVSADQLLQLPQVKLYTGTPIEAGIVTDKGLCLSFLMQPFIDSFARAFREE